MDGALLSTFLIPASVSASAAAVEYAATGSRAVLSSVANASADERSVGAINPENMLSFSFRSCKEAKGNSDRRPSPSQNSSKVAVTEFPLRDLL